MLFFGNTINDVSWTHGSILLIVRMSSAHPFPLGRAYELAVDQLSSPDYGRL